MNELCGVAQKNNLDSQLSAVRLFSCIWFDEQEQMHAIGVLWQQSIQDHFLAFCIFVPASVRLYICRNLTILLGTNCFSSSLLCNKWLQSLQATDWWQLKMYARARRATVTGKVRNLWILFVAKGDRSSFFSSLSHYLTIMSDLFSGTLIMSESIR